MTPRTWLSIIGTPILAGAVYAWLTLSSRSPAIIPKHPTVTSLVVAGAVVSLFFELTVVLPLFLTLRPRQWPRGIMFVLLASVAWFALSFLSMLFAVGVSAAFTNSIKILLPGVTLVLAFWFLGARRGA